MNNETVKCLICNKTFKQITATHLAKEHAITVAAYRKMFPTTSLVAKDISKKISESAKILCKNNIIGFKKKHRINCNRSPSNKGKKGHPAWSKGLSKKTNKILEEAAKKISVTAKEQYANGSRRKLFGKDNPMFGKKLSEEHKLALWSGWKKRPTRPEGVMKDILDKYMMSWKYVGDGKFWLRTKKQNRNPDFINIFQRKIIEVYGNYWHKFDDPRDIIAEYAKIGWTALVFWESDIYGGSILDDIEHFSNYKYYWEEV